MNRRYVCCKAKALRYVADCLSSGYHHSSFCNNDKLPGYCVVMCAIRSLRSRVCLLESLLTDEQKLDVKECLELFKD